MAYTQAQIDALKKAIASGVLTVRDGESQVTYRSMDDMLKALALMEAEVNPSSRAPRRSVASFSRGL